MLTQFDYWCIIQDMATKRGICSYCNTKKITNRIFQVNPEATVCYCPNCMHEMEPQEAINNYVVYIDNMNRKADDTLFVACNPTVAYQEYADVIEIDNTNTHAYLGRLLCLIYMSKVRENFIDEAKILLSEEAPFRFHKGINPEEYLKFLKKINSVTDEYEVALHKKLVFRKFFYDLDCLRLYLRHLYAIICFKELLLDEAKFLKKKLGDNQDLHVFLSVLEYNIEEQNEILRDKEHVTTEGRHYKFDHVKRNKEIDVVELEEKYTNTYTARYRMATLDSDDKKKRFITDTIFRDYTPIIAMIRNSLVFMVIYLLVAAAAGVVAAIFRNNNLIFLLALVIGGVFLVTFLVTFIVRLTWKRVIKKRKLAAS